MSEAMKLAASVRDRGGKGASRAVRLTGRVPAVLYGNKTTPTMIHVPEKELTRLLHTGHFMNSVVEVEVDGQVERTLPRDVQFHPVSDRPIHVDFLRLAAGATIDVAVPVHFTHEDQSPGMKRGGTLNVVRHEIELTCPSDGIPDRIDISLAGLDIGDSVHISAVRLPEGVTSVITDRDFTIVSLVAPSALQSADAAADEALAAAAAAESAAAAPAKA